ncbi:hypothetical protein NPX79_02125 [Spiroplasma endosymbiont of Anurida maritima]|uniref:hypothetical protein n=1 Tax=Spiroplasma endosymbiont of Anurida maritima TaxID=2967972 RepID=UPI0036D262E6
MGDTKWLIKDELIKEHYLRIQKQLALIIHQEKIILTTDPILILYNQLINLKHNNRIIDVNEFLKELNLIIGDLYKTINLKIDSLLYEIRLDNHRFRKINTVIQDLKAELHEQAIAIARERYGDQIADIDFFYEVYLLGILTQNYLADIRKNAVYFA